MKDWRTYYDPLNFFPEKNYNRNNVKKITKEIMDYAFIDSYCYQCKLEKEAIIPSCITKCRFKLHFRDGHTISTGRGKGRPAVELKYTDYQGTLYISRPHLVLNYMLDTGFIFRKG